MNRMRRYNDSVIWTQDEIQLQSIDQKTGQPYMFWASATWVVDLDIRSYPATPRSWDYPGDPGEVEFEVIGYELDECQVWIPQEYIDSGAVQLDLNEIVGDNRDGLVEINPRVDQERLISQSFNQERFENSMDSGDIPAYEEPGPEDAFNTDTRI